MRELQEGDIVNVDVSTYVNGYHGDLNEVREAGAFFSYGFGGVTGAQLEPKFTLEAWTRDAVPRLCEVT